MSFRVLIVGGTGQVGDAVVRALVAEPACAEIVMVNRRALPSPKEERVRHVVTDTSAATLPDTIAALARSLAESGERVVAASCVGVGAGSGKWSEADLRALEIGVVGGFARGCHAGGVRHFALLSAVGSNAKSRVRYIRVMGEKEDALRAIGFDRLAIFQPGIIGGNVHTPRIVDWLGRLVPGGFGTIAQDDIGRAFVAELRSTSGHGVLCFENGAMRNLSRSLG